MMNDESFTKWRNASVGYVMDQQQNARLYSSVFNRRLNVVRLEGSEVACCGRLFHTIGAA